MKKICLLLVMMLLTSLARAQGGHFEVVLTECGPQKLQVIKVVRDATGLGLKAAKDLVESCPQVVKRDLELSQAQALEKKLEAVGAKADVRALK
ncbi:ribosomal protein L7/L12 [bacterium CPR1]|nr:ribosomal protein L7/L12 [bacterium CPR1]